ncbi:MAG: glycosyltransferase family 4 protein [Caldilineaceae bacterium]|nr:glycosyltransferase family 4 protein [Caldilineaceae bacterium]
MSGLRISFLLSSLWLSGGVRAVIEYANRLAARGHTVTLIIPAGSCDAGMAREIAPAVTMVASAMQRPGRSLAQHMRLAWSLARAVPPSDVVIATHTPTTVPGYISTHLLRRGQPVWLFMDYPAMFEGRPLELWLLRHALRWHKRALTLSQSGTRILRENGPDDIPVQTVGLGLSHLHLLQPRPLAQRPAQAAQRILYVGDMRPRKGLREFLAAAALLHAQRPNLCLCIASKQPCTFDTPVPHEFFLHPDQAELARLYASSDLFVSASWGEGLGMPPLEAMACATPVVMTDSGGGMEYARHEENCLVVPPRDPQALARAMRRVLDDRDLALRLSQAGPPTAAQFSWEPVMDRMESALCEAARG